MSTILRRSWIVALLVLILTISPALAQDQPKRGGTVTMAVWQEPDNLNLALSYDAVTRDIMRFSVEGLTGINDKGERYPLLAEELPTVANGGVSADGKTVTWKLKKGVRFSDGSPFTCEDVQFTHKSNIAAGSATTSPYVQSVECRDPYTAVVNLKNLSTTYLGFLSYYIFPKNAGDPVNIRNWPYNYKAVGTGPFKVDELVKGDHITLSRNEYYRESDKPYLDKIIVRIVPSRDAVKALLRVGEADIAWYLNEGEIPELGKMTEVKISASPASGGDTMVLNLVNPGDPADNKTPHPILGDVRVRQAIAYGVNKQRIVDRLLGGKCPLGTSMLNIEPINCNLKPWPYDPAKARQLLEEAGWKVGALGIRVRDGQRLTLKHQSLKGDKLKEDAQKLIVEDMKAIGIEFVTDNPPTPYLLGSWESSPVRRGNFDIVMYMLASDIDPHGYVRSFYHSNGIPSPENQGGWNEGRWNDPETDRLIDEAGSIPDWSKRLELYCKVMARTFEAAAPYIYLYQRMGIYAYRDHLQGWNWSYWSKFNWNSQDWWVK